MRLNSRLTQEDKQSLLRLENLLSEMAQQKDEDPLNEDDSFTSSGDDSEICDELEL